jgi:hypothetical protein
MTAAASLLYAPAFQTAQEASEAELLEAHDAFRASILELIDKLADLGKTGIPFEPTWGRQRFAEEIAQAQSFLGSLSNEIGPRFSSPILRGAADLLPRFDRACRDAADVMRAHAAACAIALGTEAALRQIPEADLDKGARVLARHHPLFAGYVNLAPEHRELLDALRA